MSGDSSVPFTEVTSRPCSEPLSLFPGKSGLSHYELNVHNLLGNNYLK